MLTAGTQIELHTIPKFDHTRVLHIDAGKYNVDIVQSQDARYATSRYHNTSSVTVLLDLDRESLWSRRVKSQLITL